MISYAATKHVVGVVEDDALAGSHAGLGGGKGDRVAGVGGGAGAAVGAGLHGDSGAFGRRRVDPTEVRQLHAIGEEVIDRADVHGGSGHVDVYRVSLVTPQDTQAAPLADRHQLDGGDAADALASVRLSLGPTTTDDDVDLALKVVPDAVARLRGA